MKGIRWHLIAVTGTTTTVILGAFLVPTAVLLDRGAEQRAVSTATVGAQTTAALVALEPDNAPLGPNTTLFLPDGTTRGAPARRDAAVDLATHGRAFVSRTGDGVAALFPVHVGSTGTVVVRYAVPAAELRRGVAATMAMLSVVAVALLLAAVLLADRLGRRLVSSARSLAGTANRLSGGDLEARTTPAGPVELSAAGSELNRLADRIGELLAEQREEAAALAHRLRTPLTVLRLDAAGLRDPGERDRLETSVEHLAVAVDEVIQDARRPVREGVHPVTDLCEVVSGRLGLWSALAEDTGRRLVGALPPGPLPVRLAHADAVAVVDALLDNVFAHTPAGTDCRVEISTGQGGDVRLTVSDDGTATPATQAPQTARPGTTGLGLTVARRIAAHAGGGVEFTTGETGTVVVVTLGRPDASRRPSARQVGAAQVSQSPSGPMAK